LNKPFHRLIALGFAVLVLAGCAGRSYIVLVTATPAPSTQVGQIPTPGESATSEGVESLPVETPRQPPPTAPQYALTPNPTRIGLPDPVEQDLYVVQTGDTLRQIADGYGVTLEALMEANDLPNEDILVVGQALLIPLGVSHHGPDAKLIPDSELVYGPRVQGFDVNGFVASQPGYLKSYTEEIEGYTFTGAQIVDRVALETSVNPRLLLALLEYESGWLSGHPSNDFSLVYPMNYLENGGLYSGLYKQLGWAANQLNAGYYGWRQQGLWAILLADGTRVAYAPTLNAGTAGVQNMLARTRGWDQWQHAVSYLGFWQTYYIMFGDPFQYNYDPLLPPDLSQPQLSFPWAPGESWYYTGGPHGGWASGTAWAAIDFATGDLGQGCYLSSASARAVADGVIARSEPGLVVLDLDGDGFEGTGWTIFYLHIDSEGRAVQEGTVVKRGDLIGHPSCEGGFSNATHLHIARRFNGEWIAADCSQCLLLTAPAPPFVMSGWTVFSLENEYDGSFINGEAYREARQSREPLNELIYYE
jgi:murein DD-endopeptidase MepM/ murein hydrolase activator NlpD